MKNMTFLAAIILLIVLSSLSTPQISNGKSCGADNANKTAFVKIELAQQGVFKYQETLNMKPPFYDGNLPLVFVSGKKAIGQSEMITVSQDFGQFYNSFTYTDVAMKYSGIADGARTNDSSGKLLAEAKLLRLVKGEGIYIEERHYGVDGKVAFQCVSFVEFRSGFKKGENDEVGKKRRDYYFLWPVRPF
jgi:hypothetical protein